MAIVGRPLLLESHTPDDGIPAGLLIPRARDHGAEPRVGVPPQEVERHGTVPVRLGEWVDRLRELEACGDHDEVGVLRELKRLYPQPVRVVET